MDEKGLYRYVYDWKVDKVSKTIGKYPRIWLSKNDNLTLNFSWRCYYLEGAELNFKKINFLFSLSYVPKVKNVELISVNANTQGRSVAGFGPVTN